MSFSGLLLVILLAVSGGLGMPVGVPPAPEDPIMSRVIPDDVLLVASWAGVAALDPDADPTQHWMAQPEIQVFSSKLVDAWKSHSSRRKRFVGSEQTIKIKKLLTDVAEASIGRATTIYVKNFDVEDHPENFRAAAIVALKDSKPSVVSMLDELVSECESNPSKYFSWLEKNGVKRFRYRDTRYKLVTEIAVWKGYFIIAIGDGELDEVIANAQTDPPDWYTEHRQRLPVEKFCSMSYVSRDLTLKIPRDVWRPFGWQPLDSFRGMFFVSGMDEKGMLTRASVDLIEDLQGIQDLLQTDPMEEKLFARLPERATMGTAVRVSLEDVISKLKDIGGNVGQDPIEEADRRLREELGVGLEDELLNVLDGFVGVHYTLDADRPLSQFVTTIGISDEMSFSAVHSTVLESLRKWEFPDEGKLQMEKHGIFEIYSLPLRRNFFGPRTLAWSHVREELIFGSEIETVKRHIDDTKAGRTFSKTRAYADLIQFGKQNQLDNPIAVGTVDLATVARELMKLLGRFMQEDSKLFGNLKFGDIPNVEVLTDGVEPSVLAVYRSENGFQLYGRQTLPGSSPVVSLLAGGALAGVTGLDQLIVDETRQSRNNLKQLALACLNFESALQRLPATGSRSADGKPLLSWRVHILPLLDQGKLHAQFHFDEPWDSPHNKTLIDQMPAVFQHPGISIEEGKTVYLGVAGKNGPMGELSERRTGAKIGMITDGTSNTVLVVECGSSAAVTWTKPVDLTTEGDQAVEATKDVQSRICNVVMCDGSVHQVKKVSAEVWSRLLNMRDGQVENIEDHGP